jgi:rubrerythrin
MDSRNAELKTPMEILTKALEKERQAFEFYSAMLDQTRVRMLQELLATLKDEEQKHMRMIQGRIAELELGRG